MISLSYYCAFNFEHTDIFMKMQLELSDILGRMNFMKCNRRIKTAIQDFFFKNGARCARILESIT